MSGPRTIGRVLESIRAEFPDISVSKLRYLEAEGLISPDRQQPSGYRRFTEKDIERLLYVLRAQRDRYLPLRIIREELDALDRGEEIPAHHPEESEEEEQKSPVQEPPKRLSTSRKNAGSLLSRRQILAESGLGEASFIHLERLKLVQTRRGTQLYGREAVAIAVAAKKLAHYGVDIRQLKVIQQAAFSEAALVEQTLGPFQKRNNQSNEALVDLYRVVMQAHAAFLHGHING